MINAIIAIKVKNNDIINFFNNCNGNLCENCNRSHKNYPAHMKAAPKVIILDKYRILKIIANCQYINVLHVIKI